MIRKTFGQKVRDVVKQIPEGHTMTYKEVAICAGSPKAYRAVGTIMKQNFDPAIPCHRVVRSDGTVGGYNRGGPQRKKVLLSQEVIFSDVRALQKSLEVPHALAVEAAEVCQRILSE